MVKTQVFIAQGRTVYFTADTQSSQQASWGTAQAPGGHSPATGLQSNLAPCTTDGYRPHSTKHCCHVIQSSLREWEGRSKVVCDHMITDAITNMLAETMCACLEGIFCLVTMLQLGVKDALGLGSTIKATWHAALLEMWSFLEICQHLVTKCRGYRSADVARRNSK